MTPQQATLYDAVAKLIRAKGRFHTEQNYAALVTAFDAETVARRAPAPTEPAVDRDAILEEAAALFDQPHMEYFGCNIQEDIRALKLATPASPAVPARDHLLKIIAFAYQIAGWHDAPEHILAVLAHPESATAAQVDAMLPYQVGGGQAVPGDRSTWKLMPPDATEAMMHAAQDVPSPRPYGAVYRAMFSAAPAVPEHAPLAPSEAILKARAEGRAEAVQIIMGMDAEDALGELTGWSSPVGPEDEGSAYWDLAKLQEKFACDDVLLNLFDKAEAMYWEASAERDEAVRAKAFAENMGSSAKVRDILAKAGEFDLMGQLCRPADPAPQVAQPSGNTGELPQVAQASQTTSAEGKDSERLEGGA